MGGFLIGSTGSPVKKQAFQGCAIAPFDAAKLLTNRLRQPFQSLPHKQLEWRILLGNNKKIYRNMDFARNISLLLHPNFTYNFIVDYLEKIHYFYVVLNFNWLEFKAD